MTPTLNTTVLAYQVYEGVDFSNRELSGREMCHSTFKNCNFDGADLSQADCSFSDFTGSSFIGTSCYETNFHRAKLACTKFEPRDAYGMTISLHCKTFENATISQIFWFAWLMFLTSMIPATRPVREPLRDQLLALVGPDRYVKLKQLFQREI